MTLHADILRPANLPSGAKTPAILSVGPYFNHSGQVGAAGPVQDASYDPVGPPGPSDRFLDLIEGANLMERGYTFVMVDLRGFGGSSGCLDWSGPGEQADVVSAVKWAASQPWSTGKVGMYGRSYAGVTGLIGVHRRPAGLKAVVSQEPVYDLYRYLYGDGIRRLNSLLTPALYDLIDLTPGPVLDDPAYNTNGLNDTQRPGCPVLNLSDQGGSGIGPLITRQGSLARSSGPKTLDLWSADWKLAPGHRIAVRVTDPNEDWGIHTPLFDTVRVVGGSVTLPFLTYQRTDTIQGDPGTQLEGYLDETITVPPETLRDSVSSSFRLPPPQQPRP